MGSNTFQMQRKRKDDQWSCLKNKAWKLSIDVMVITGTGNTCACKMNPILPLDHYLFPSPEQILAQWSPILILSLWLSSIITSTRTSVVEANGENGYWRLDLYKQLHVMWAQYLIKENISLPTLIFFFFQWIQFPKQPYLKLLAYGLQWRWSSSMGLKDETILHGNTHHHTWISLFHQNNGTNDSLCFYISFIQ